MSYERKDVTDIFKLLVSGYGNKKEELLYDCHNTDDIPMNIMSIIDSGYSGRKFSDDEKRGIIDNIMQWIADMSASHPAT